MKRNCWLIALACAPLASAADTVKLLPTPLELPARIGPLQIHGEPHRFEPAELGVSYQYLGAGLSLTVYVYNAGIADIPDGGDSMPTCWLFEQAKQEVGAAGYANVRLVSEQLVRLSPPADSPLAREAVFEYQRGGNQTISYLWITGAAKHFVKMRFSMGADLRDEAIEARRVLLTALGDAVKPHLAPVDPAARESDISLNITGEEDLSIGLLYMGMLSAALEKSTLAAGLVCGGEYVPPYETELSVFRALLSVSEEGDTSALGKKLVAAENAGLLEEFVWTERHRDEWGDQAPEGLTLPEYKTWKKKNLKRFKVPALGSVILNHPQPMQVEAPDAP